MYVDDLVAGGESTSEADKIKVILLICFREEVSDFISGICMNRP